MQFTESEIKSLQDAFDFFNQRLFDGDLSQCMLLLHRHRGAAGFFRPESFEDRNRQEFKLHEIALNPDTFGGRTDIEILSTLVHEQCHQWQQEFGKPPRKCYHDKQWADKMEEVGLVPSTTGEAGGKRTGQKVSHYIMPGGPFETEARELIENGFKLGINGIPSIVIPAKKTKVKYVCEACEVKAWAKPGVNLVCGTCGAQMDELDL